MSVLYDHITNNCTLDITKKDNHKMIQVYLCFIFFWQSWFHVSDVGINLLLGFFATFFLLLAKALHIQSLNHFASELPKTVITARKLMSYNRDDFEKWVTCPQCSSLYQLSDCIEKQSDGTYVSKKCNHVKFPNHPQLSKQKPVIQCF